MYDEPLTEAPKMTIPRTDVNIIIHGGSFSIFLDAKQVEMLETQMSIRSSVLMILESRTTRAVFRPSEVIAIHHRQF